MERLLALALAASLALVIYFKTTTGRGWFLLMPCHYFSCIQVYLLLAPRSAWTERVFNHYIYIVWPQIMAVIFPDTTGYSCDIEMYLYWVQHTLLIVIPLYTLVMRTERLWPYSWRTHFTCFAIATLTQHNVLTLCSIMSGKNINFMLCPPKIAAIRAAGEYYRPVTHVVAFVLKLITRLVLPIVAFVLRLPVTLLGCAAEKPHYS
jgi:hypothetical protein